MAAWRCSFSAALWALFDLIERVKSSLPLYFAPFPPSLFPLPPPLPSPPPPPLSSSPPPLLPPPPARLPSQPIPTHRPMMPRLVLDALSSLKVHPPDPKVRAPRDERLSVGREGCRLEHALRGVALHLFPCCCVEEANGLGTSIE